MAVARDKRAGQRRRLPAAWRACDQARGGHSVGAEPLSRRRTVGLRRKNDLSVSVQWQSQCPGNAQILAGVVGIDGVGDMIQIWRKSAGSCCLVDVPCRTEARIDRKIACDVADRLSQQRAPVRGACQRFRPLIGRIYSGRSITVLHYKGHPTDGKPSVPSSFHFTMPLTRCRFQVKSTNRHFLHF